MNIFRNITFRGRTQGPPLQTINTGGTPRIPRLDLRQSQRADAPNTASGSSTRLAPTIHTSGQATRTKYQSLRQGRSSDAQKNASGSWTRANVVESGSIVSHSRAGGNLFIFDFKHTKWISACAGMTSKSKYLRGFIKPMTNVFRYTAILFLMFICANSVSASVEYVSSEIDTGDNRQGYWNADMNGDNLQDILIATWSEANGREFLIYTQEANGKFTGTPWRRIEIKKDIVAFAVADLRPEPGSELLLFTGSACYSLSCIKEGYTNNLKKLFEWELIKSVPDKKKIDYIGELKDLNNDRFVDILLPGQKQYALFTGQPDEEFSSPSILPAAEVIINKSLRDQRSFTLGSGGVSAGGPDIYSNLLVSRLDSGPFPRGIEPPVLNYEHWIPVISTGRFNTDNLEDFIYLDDIETDKNNTKRLNLVYQEKPGELPSAPQYQAEITVNDSLKLMEVNGDRLTDLVTVKTKGLNTTLYIFLNHEGRFNFENPDHVMKLTGLMSDFQAMDLNRDGFPELVINTYSASPVKAVASGSVGRRLLIFAGRKPAGGASLFDRKPAFTNEENITAGNFKSLTGERSFSGDIDGDGINDVVSIDSNGALAAHRITSDLKLEAKPVLRFAPRHYISGTRLVSLNQDNRTDIIVEQEHGLSLIISRKGAQQ